MNYKDDTLLDMDFVDTIIDKPQGFSVGGRHFYIYPVTLGKMFIIGRLTEELDLRYEVIRTNPYIEAIRLAKYKRDTCCRILTYHTVRTKAKAFDNEFIENRTKFFVKEISDEDLATIMVLVLTWDKTPLLISHLNIDKEQQKFEKAVSVKENKNTLVFGCRSIYGSLIDVACERYGWTFDYVVWEISYVNLKLLIADSSKQVYLSDNELNKANISTNRQYLNGDDPEEVKKFIENTRT